MTRASRSVSLSATLAGAVLALGSASAAQCTAQTSLFSPLTMAGAASAAPDAGATTAATADPAPSGRAAREVSLQETGHLHAVGEPGETVIEKGTATGTYHCAITVRLRIVSANAVTASFTVKPSDGTVTGTGSARFAQKGADGYFGGTIAISGGSGSFAHASGNNIGISGVISRETFAMTVHVHGTIHV